jgi:hypothetical protein
MVAGVRMPQWLPLLSLIGCYLALAREAWSSQYITQCFLLDGIRPMQMFQVGLSGAVVEAGVFAAVIMIGWGVAVACAYVLRYNKEPTLCS